MTALMSKPDARKCFSCERVVDNQGRSAVYILARAAAERYALPADAEFAFCARRKLPPPGGSNEPLSLRVTCINVVAVNAVATNAK